MRPFLSKAVALAAGLAAFVSPVAAPAQATAGGRPAMNISVPVTHNRYAYVDGVKNFYREAGPADGPAVFLPHGFPSSSYMFRNLIPFLADRYHVIAPDYPGFGLSDAPDPTNFAYTFAHDATFWKHDSPPNRAKLAFLVTLKSTKLQYLAGVRDDSRVDPDDWGHDQTLHDYGSNVLLYPRFQRFFRERRPSALIMWGNNDPFFPAAGAYPYRRDLPDAEFHFIDSGHYLLEDRAGEAFPLIRGFLDRKVAGASSAFRHVKRISRAYSGH